MMMLDCHVSNVVETTKSFAVLLPTGNRSRQDGEQLRLVG